MTWCNAVNLIVKFISFADDATLFGHILKDSDNCFLQSGIHSLKQWSDHWLLKLNISKYKIVSFGRYVDKNYVYNINENNQVTPLEYKESYKDLGVIFDEKLTFRDRYMINFIKHMQCLE